MRCVTVHESSGPDCVSPWHDAADVAYEDLPEDMQVLILQFTLDYDETIVIPERLRLGTIPVDGLPVVPLDRSGRDRGVEHAMDMDLLQVPPILIAHGCFLDGRHRTFAARSRGQASLVAIDLTGIAPLEAVEANGMGKVSGFVLRDEDRDHQPEIGPGM
ncbi:hypothetical protein LAZ40_01495 [Cereibacter sphaeroides]|uniref:hypothetical protein n=1 Tax=Cereibacter sphaeroides TaxID=1063 RepID=UPI001F218987|nr:hypothetical protein [Cereibacter sphaeroides]MCE6957734.1 hypothetical protein [Cereibacter sphaeroides]MCE6971520.1 hypothetical protein [Cereibacter sphaeroides]